MAQVYQFPQWDLELLPLSASLFALIFVYRFFANRGNLPRLVRQKLTFRSPPKESWYRYR